MPSLLFGLSAFAIVCSIVLGGGTQGAFLLDGLLQFLTIPLLLLVLWRLLDLRSSAVTKVRPLKWELLLCGALLLWPFLQLVPLPPLIWAALPGRKPEAAVFELLGGEVPWMPMSVSPQATWLSALSLFPPIAIFLGCALLDYRERRVMSQVVLSVGLVSVFLGLLQVSQGVSSPLRFFEFTNPTEAVGFFANRNHLAALLYALTLIAAAWTINSTFDAQSGGARYDVATIAALLASFTALIVLVSTQSIARSRAGLGLTIVAIFGAFALAYLDRRLERHSLKHNGRRRSPGLTPVKLLLGATGIAFLFAIQFALYRMLERFGSDPLDDSRIPFARNTIEAAKAYMPFGSGMGTFVPVYGIFEKPQDVLVNRYINHAHNDLLEVALESGLVGIVLVGAFVIWWLRRSVKIWQRAPVGDGKTDQILARAATLIIGLLLVHSFVDYPLRTGAMMAVMAFACALLVNPRSRAGSEVKWVDERTQRKSTRQVGITGMPSARRCPQPVLSRDAAPATIPPSHPVEVDVGVDWPEAWRSPPDKRQKS
jgi:O-antigen ligase